MEKEHEDRHNYGSKVKKLMEEKQMFAVYTDQEYKIDRALSIKID